VIETLLGVNLQGETLHLTPRLPSAWTTMKVHYRFRSTVYHITYTRWTDPSEPAPAPKLDGQPLPGAVVPLGDDRQEHWVDVPFA
jgi:cellobiose phosphorylase